MSETMLRMRIARRVPQTPDIVSFELVNASGGKLPAFTAGAHIDVHLPNGLIRQYSLCSSPADLCRYVIGVLKDPNSRGGSAAVHALREGDEVHISVPRNRFPLTEAAHTALIAGGIGVTPLLAMAEQMLLDCSNFDIHLCTRSPEHTPFGLRWAAPEFAGKVHFHHTFGEASRRVDFAALLGRPEARSQVYVCGPGEFINAVLTAGRQQGFAESQLRCEYFSAASAGGVSGDSVFSVVLEKSGVTLEIPIGVTIVEVLRERGIEKLVSCEQGVCGTCLTRVIEGRPDHRDMFLTDEERALNDQMTVCCSRSLTPTLTLDI